MSALVSKLCDVEKKLERLNSELEYHDNYSLDENDLSRTLSKVYKDLYGAVKDLMKPLEVRNFKKKWSLINKFLQKRGFFTTNPRPDRVERARTELMAFAVSSIVWTMICEPYLLGATSEQTTVLEDLEKGIRDLWKDDKATRDWRSDTFRGLALSHGYANNVALICRQTGLIMQDMLKVAGIRRKASEEFWREIDKAVVRPIAEISTKISCSPLNYEWDWTFPHPLLKKRDLERFESLNIKADRSDLRQRRKELPDKGVIGHCLFTIFPILRRSKGSNENVIVSKGWVAVDVAVKNPFGREGGRGIIR